MSTDSVNEQIVIIVALHIYFEIKLSGDYIAAFGYAHKTNFLKFRILEALINSEEPLTTRDIERLTGVQYTMISAAMSRYQKIHKKSGATIKLPYIQRLAKKGPNGLYRYKITKPSGILLVHLSASKALDIVSGFYVYLRLVICT